MLEEGRPILLVGGWVEPGMTLRSHIALLAHGIQTKSAVLTASLRQGWDLRFLLSSREALSLLCTSPLEMLVYDWDSRDGDWRKLCHACVDRGAIFVLVANRPSDGLFLEVVAAGGAGVLYKPLTAERIVSSIRTGRRLSAEAGELRVGR
jgi:hypothetical protein